MRLRYVPQDRKWLFSVNTSGRVGYVKLNETDAQCPPMDGYFDYQTGNGWVADDEIVVTGKFKLDFAFCHFLIQCEE